MRVEKLGDGEPEVAVVGAIHGDEPCGEKAIEQFLDSDFEVKKPVKLIIANEKALEKDTRFVDCDLNRSFPGDLKSEDHEERLAAEIMAQVEGLKVLGLHSTKSYADPFVALSSLEPDNMDLVRKTGIRTASYHRDKDLDTLDDHAKCVEVECGFQGSESAVDNAYRIVKNFLAAYGIIDAEHRISSPSVFEIYDTVEEPDYEFIAVNFQKVEEGEVYARNGSKELRADEDFYPVLMSTEGYDTILGHKARKVENPESLTQEKNI
ncbi:succinylglutamate desuccinylase/aspartoacylase domain-containing protein [Candidatus Nanohalobium constans]|uniref:Succinylglutamate desuccinylase/aspartoacylase n=1 Tax=Candidatus Nanohalobium constans TaxID=2565781 RepID=A0A5Q0UFI4_9ARCH|nr:succinylglutamate desuccinylase/aspartoacylase family protein [Candidatus Nanohalobium constans]QGA80372.1 succinylglutamate desuccinylase/aspartoacylase [Candidatus Nanohalobium constans]